MLVSGITRDAIRFTFSPLQEVVRALKVFVAPRPHAEQMAWLRYARRRSSQRVKSAAKRFSSLLTPAPELFPNILPSSNAETFAAELALLSKSRRDFREAMVRRFVGKPFLMRSELTPTARRAALSLLADETSTHDVDEVLGGFCSLLEEFYERCLSPQWEHFESAALRDAQARETLLKRFGVTSTLRTLTRELTVNGDRKTAAVQFGGKESANRQLQLSATGTLVLTPSYFIWPEVTFLILRAESVDFRIAYPIPSPSSTRRRLESWDGAAKRLSALADPTRLRMLELLANRNLSTREFAGMLGLSESGVSRHLSILRDAELVATERDSYFVLYQRTPLASRVLNAVLHDGAR